MADVDGLVAFLEARLRAEEALARGATQFNGTDWNCPCTGAVQFGPPDNELVAFADRDLAEHIAAHDPAYVLADIAAKRQIIEDYQIVLAKQADEPDTLKATAFGLVAKSLRMVLCRLAAVYPDFKPSWSVT
jgi:Family of unknown function (DUF6221)